MSNLLNAARAGKGPKERGTKGQHYLLYFDHDATWKRITDGIGTTSPADAAAAVLLVLQYCPEEFSKLGDIAAERMMDPKTTKARGAFVRPSKPDQSAPAVVTPVAPVKPVARKRAKPAKTEPAPVAPVDAAPVVQ